MIIKRKIKQKIRLSNIKEQQLIFIKISTMLIFYLMFSRSLPPPPFALYWLFYAKRKNCFVFCLGYGLFESAI